jgi:membrane-associated phospholipid phosphatase
LTGSFITRLRTGIPRDEMGPWLPRETIPVYAIALIGTLAVTLAFTLTSFTLATAVPTQLATVAILLIVSGVLARRYRLGELDTLLEGIGLIGLMSLLCQLGSILLSASQMPLADPWLARTDAAIGFDWFAMVRFLRTHDTVLATAEYLYHALTWQPGLVVLLLVVTRQRDRCWTFLTAWGVALVVTLVIWPLAPATSTFPHYGVPRSALPHMVSRLPWAVPDVIGPIRRGTLRSIDLDTFIGLVSFPSFHAAGATILGWAMLGTRLLWLPFALLNVGVTASALVDGGHYLVDLIAGCGVACLSIVLAKAPIARLWDGHAYPKNVESSPL